MNVKETRERAELMLKACKIAEDRGLEYFNNIVEARDYGSWGPASNPYWFAEVEYRINPKCLKRPPKVSELRKGGWVETDVAIHEVHAISKTTGRMVLAICHGEMISGLKVINRNRSEDMHIDTFCEQFTRPDGSDFYIRGDSDEC